jgi:hypothetical protein
LVSSIAAAEEHGPLPIPYSSSMARGGPCPGRAAARSGAAQIRDLVKRF